MKPMYLIIKKTSIPKISAIDRYFPLRLFKEWAFKDNMERRGKIFEDEGDRMVSRMVYGGW